MPHSPKGLLGLCCHTVDSFHTYKAPPLPAIAAVRQIVNGNAIPFGSLSPSTKSSSPWRSRPHREGVRLSADVTGGAQPNVAILDITRGDMREVAHVIVDAFFGDAVPEVSEELAELLLLLSYYYYYYYYSYYHYYYYYYL